MMDRVKARNASLRCWRRLINAIEELPDSDRKQYELDAIFEMDWMRKEIELL